MPSNISLHLGDCLEVLRSMPADSVDSIVTDPPYGLSFMGKRWDYDVPATDIWRECLRVLKPGGHLLAFAGTRTQHRMAVNIEDAGFEIRDMIAWVYGSGFPKSKNVSLSIDKGGGHPNRGRAIPTASLYQACDISQKHKLTSNDVPSYKAKTQARKQWQGWGTALKPALEPVTVARKPLIGTVAENVLAHGTGAINVDGCRVGSEQRINPAFGVDGWRKQEGRSDRQETHEKTVQGRWPANLIHDGSDEVVGLFPQQDGQFGCKAIGKVQFMGSQNQKGGAVKGTKDSGSAARFFYCAKANKKDRDEGCEGFDEKVAKRMQAGGDDTRGRPTPINRNHHPTVKPTDLMRYLVRLVTPPNGTVLDPFMGSGSTGKACVLEGFSFVGIEREAEYLTIARARIAAVQVKQSEELPLG